MARIAFLIPDLGGGGAERVAVTLIEGFIARGHEVDVLLLRKAGQFLDMLPAEARVVDFHASQSRHAILPLWRYLRARRPDALQVSMWSLTIIGILVGRLARGRKMRIVTSDHASLSRQFGDSRRTLRAIRWSVRLIYPLADARVCVSSGTAEDLAALSGLDRNAFTVVHNPIPGPTGPIVVSRDVDARWRSSGARILSVGSLKLQKNHDLLIRAFAEVRKVRDAQLMILGAGTLQAALEARAAFERVADSVIFAGFDRDPWPYYQSADLFVLSSDYEGFGNVIVEALHCGLPVVSTDCPDGPAEILADGKFGALVPCGDVAALAQAMLGALDGPRDPARLRQRAGDFAPDRAVSEYLRLLADDGGPVAPAAQLHHVRTEARS